MRGMSSSNCAGSTLAHGSQCGIACPTGLAISGKLPSCFAGKWTVGWASCRPKECIVPSGLAAPVNGSLVSPACSANAKIPNGSSDCDVTCRKGFKLVGVQPKCAYGIFTPGDVSCRPSTSNTSSSGLESSSAAVEESTCRGLGTVAGPGTCTCGTGGGRRRTKTRGSRISRLAKFSANKKSRLRNKITLG